jgi:alpha-amylase
VEKLGFVGMLAEGVDRYLFWKKPNFVYHAKDLPNFKLLLKNYRLSDDIAFRFGQKSWSQWPLTAEKFHSLVR